MNRKDLPEATIAEMRRLREEGKYWHEIAKALGIHPQTVRRRIDPTFVPPKSVVYDAVGQADIGPVPPADVIAERRRYQAQRHDTITGALFGDPLPGRRAIDRHA